MAQGYIKLHRKLQGNWLWQEKRVFSKAEAWIDLLFMMNHKESKVSIGNEIITVQRGSRIISIRQLCDRWKWSNTKVKAFLDLLQSDEMIVYFSDKKKTVVTAVNWDLYQCDNDDKTSQKHRKNVTSQSQKHTNNNDKNDNNEKNDKKLYGEFVLLTNKEHQELTNRFKDDLPRMIEILNNYLGQNEKNRKRYTSHNHVLRGWVKDRLAEEKLKSKPKTNAGEYLQTNWEEYKNADEW